MKKFIASLLFVLSFTFFVLPVNADSGCSGQYGQYGSCAPSTSITVSKMVGKPDISITDPAKGNYVDNLTPSDPRFSAGQTVFFRIRVKNTSTTTLSNVTLKDFVPNYLNPLQGPGTFDTNTRIIAFTLGDMNADEERIFYLKMQVMNQDQLPTDKGLFCTVNKAEAYNDKAYDNSTSQLCIEKQITTSITKVPSSGPEFGLVLLGLNLMGIGAGLALKKRSF